MDAEPAKCYKLQAAVSLAGIKEVRTVSGAAKVWRLRGPGNARHKYTACLDFKRSRKLVSANHTCLGEFVRANLYQESKAFAVEYRK
jgi:hypothetical protein